MIKSTIRISIELQFAPDLSIRQNLELIYIKQ